MFVARTCQAAVRSASMASTGAVALSRTGAIQQLAQRGAARVNTPDVTGTRRRQGDESAESRFRWSASRDGFRSRDREEEGPKMRPVVWRSAEWGEEEPPAVMEWRGSDRTKTSLIEMHHMDPSKWTPDRLASHYMLSLDRVQAIIRMDNFERSLKDKSQLDELWATEDDKQLLRDINTNTGMSDDQVDHIGRPEPILASRVGLSRPMFRVVEDDEMEEFYKRVEEEAGSNAPKYVPDRVDTSVAKVLKQAPSQKNAKVDSEFMFNVLGAANQEEKVIVRQRDGALRTASGEERLKVEKLTSNKTIKPLTRF
eukprot:comp22038_c0_seq1/m.32001 comp22038_c0_seq1/g.32001  ORF comp22038_c0_seq1/g.32001 comp22038_c0_seq1/m.32001 type:complete len:312 (-) comp22038_c0_seq1:53-988(-)